MDRLADDFWNIRGSHRVGGVLDIGTHMSIVRRADGRFVVVDGCALDASGRSALLALTEGGSKVAAVVHVHPFHTLHVDATQALFPGAALHGTARHRRLAPALPWSGEPVEDWGRDHPYADLFDLSVPQGVEFACADERVHVSSVLVRHRASGIVHVDDTLNVLAAPGRLGRRLPQSSLRMHPLLARALSREAGAADAYAAWALGLAARWRDTPRVCAAHSAVRRFDAGGFEREMRDALRRVEGVLAAHRTRYG